jgi:hypothetical protein
VDDILVPIMRRPETDRPALLCIPDAGSDAAMFSSWRDEIASAADFTIAYLPGREELILEDPLSTMAEVIAALVACLGRQPERAQPVVRDDADAGLGPQPAARADGRDQLVWRGRHQRPPGARRGTGAGADGRARLTARRALVGPRRRRHRRLAGPLSTTPDYEDSVTTLQRGRWGYRVRRATAAADLAAATGILRGERGEQGQLHLLTGTQGPVTPLLAWAFSGQGSLFPDLAVELAQQEPRFARHLESCFALLGPHGDALAARWRDGIGAPELLETQTAQPLLFAVELALTRIWLDRRITPAVMTGHSLGEFAAAAAVVVTDLLFRAALAATAQVRIRVASRPPGPLPVERMRAHLGRDSRLADIDKDDDYFNLGGTSVSAIELIARIRQEFGVNVTVAAMLDAPALTAITTSGTS